MSTLNWERSQEPLAGKERFELPKGEDLWERAKEAARRERTEYWIYSQPLERDVWDYHGPYKDPAEAKDAFEHTQPSFDGAGLIMDRVILPPGVEGSRLVYRAQCDLYATWGESTPDVDLLRECSETVADLKWQYERYDDPSGDGHFTGGGIEWDEEFLKTAAASNYALEAYDETRIAATGSYHEYDNEKDHQKDLAGYYDGPKGLTEEEESRFAWEQREDLFQGENNGEAPPQDLRTAGFEAELRKQIAKKMPHMTPAQAVDVEEKIGKAVQEYQQKMESGETTWAPLFNQLHALQRKAHALER